MKKIILLGITLVSVITLNAQSKLSFGVSVGAALPMGDFAKHDTAGLSRSSDTTKTGRGAGWAKTGFHFDVNATYMFSDNIGGELMIGGNMNSFDNATYMTAYGFKSPETYTNNNWYIGQYLVGPVFSFGQQLKVNIRVLVGLVTSNGPVSTETNGVSGAGAFSYTATSNAGSGFGYNFGVGIKYNFNKNLGLLVNVDYLGSSIMYTGYTTSETFGNTTFNGNHPTIKTAMALGMVNATVGIAYNL